MEATITMVVEVQDEQTLENYAYDLAHDRPDGLKVISLETKVQA